MTDAPDIKSDVPGAIAEHALQTAYWADVARKAATVSDDKLMEYAIVKAAACARAFVGAVKDLPRTTGGGKS
jgi:hypothetical protein